MSKSLIKYIILALPHATLGKLFEILIDAAL
jgi:hypothetical protein